MGCKKCAEGVCGCSTMNAEESAVQEPDWIPDGDGRAIGQQNFGINLSPLHAETFSKRHRLGSCEGCGEDIQDIDDTCPDCELGPPNYAEKHHGYECCPHYEDHGAESFEAQDENLKCPDCGGGLNMGQWGLQEQDWRTIPRSERGPTPPMQAEITIWCGGDKRGKDGKPVKEMEEMEDGTLISTGDWEKCGYRQKKIIPLEYDVNTPAEHWDKERGKYYIDAESFEADSKWTDPFYGIKRRCVECENRVAATDGDDYFVCDACVESMGADTVGTPSPTWNAPSIFPVTAMQVVIGASHGSTMDWSRIFNVNVRGSTEDLGYLTAGLEEEVKGRVAKWNKTWDAETVGTPSPTFNEGITGQDGPSDSPTNSNFSAETQTFEAMRRLAPSSRDVETARRYLKSKYGEVIYDRYLVNQAGSSNKFYYTSITHKDGKYYPMGAYGRIGSLGGLFNIKGGKANESATCSSMEEAFGYVKKKERQKVNKKGDKAYKDYTLQMAEEFESHTVCPCGCAMAGCICPATCKGECLGAEQFDAISSHRNRKGHFTGNQSVHNDTTGRFMRKGAESFKAEPDANPTGGSTGDQVIQWEDGEGYSSASMPPDNIHWAESFSGENAAVAAVKTPVGAVFVGTALALLGYSVITGGNLLKDLSAGAKSAVYSAAENRKTGGGKESVAIRKDSEYSVGQINPVEVEGETDVHGAEQVSYGDAHIGPSAIPQYSNRPSLKMW